MKARRLESFKSSLESEKRFSSYSPLTKDLITRTFCSVSWILELTLSSFFCMMVNLGKAVLIMIVMAMIMTGMITRNTLASLAFMEKAMIMAPMSIPGARSIILNPIIIRFCTCVISLVSLVTREPVEKASIFAKENFCTFLKQSFRRSAPKLMDALEANQAPPIPPPIIMKAIAIIVSPVPII